ncbi:MAG: GTPase ObgE [Acidobacteriota bacterium]
MFVDKVKIRLEAGNGGNGCVSFRREKYVPKGGPDGGDGGDGGDIYLISDRGIKSLTFFRFNPLIKSERGAHGKGSNKKGKNGKDMYLKVPVGTIIKDAETDEIIFDFISPNLIFLAAKGGKGGRGNASFITSIKRAPKIREEGKEGEKREILLELKLIADVGIVGKPNAGKSTLLSKVSAAKPLIADYPFTTLTPHLGVVDLDYERSYIIADIPGLIEGAHLGKGLGIKFLSHIERTKLLLFLLDGSSSDFKDITNQFEILKNEIRFYDNSFSYKPRIVALNKIDIMEQNSIIKKIEEYFVEKKIEFFPISALKELGLKELKEKMWEVLSKLSTKNGK